MPIRLPTLLQPGNERFGSALWPTVGLVADGRLTFRCSATGRCRSRGMIAWEQKLDQRTGRQPAFGVAGRKAEEFGSYGRAPHALWDGRRPLSTEACLTFGPRLESGSSAGTLLRLVSPRQESAGPCRLWRPSFWEHHCLPARAPRETSQVWALSKLTTHSRSQHSQC